MENRTRQILNIGIGIIVLIVGNIIGYAYPPYYAIWTPVILTIIIGTVNFPLYKTNFKWTIIYNYILLLFNDILSKRLWEGKPFDNAGKVMMFIFFLAAFLLSTIIMLMYAYKFGKAVDKVTKTKYFLSVIISAIITIIIYYYLPSFDKIKII